jgi:pimeloyl-ACP methyl ester carboxylesterase
MGYLVAKEYLSTMIDVERFTIDTATSGTMSVSRLGAGRSLLLLHRSLGQDSTAAVVDALAEKFSIIAPALPGYDDSQRPNWARSVRDIAPIVLHSISAVAEGSPVLVGLGLGGWVAAEMAVMSPDRLSALVLIAPLGVRPRSGEITDPFLVSTDHYIEMSFANVEAYKRTFGTVELGSRAWLRQERNREMTTRIAWRPRMFDQTLPYRLPYVSTPTLILWGQEDGIVPRDVVVRYRDAIPDSELVELPGCGHMLECEVPDMVCDLISSFVDKRT